ncbi:MAG TPA: Asp-tRNA(Asn)/Glu-tRNA(Gln) amidotransferase subunit GatC [Candidatus Eisenbacteria bacterium]|nr:Asp-tRNA(Asn)/Glu-tRNA(Gln) amidotransferase subunit GatC [Candidatus Eisenbacteria bacterium]
MPIDVSVVRKIAALARLRIEPSEEERYARELDGILGFVEQLQALDVSGIEPTSQVTAGERPALRPDEVCASDVRDEALAGAPERDGDYFKVPQVV